jgi:hypothetical protein
MAGRGPYGDRGTEREADDDEPFDTGVQCTRDQAVGEHVEVERRRTAWGVAGPRVIRRDDRVPGREPGQYRAEVGLRAAARSVREQQAWARTMECVGEM